MSESGAVELSSHGDGAPQSGFEGPEKNLELDFAPGVGPARGLRAISREEWDAILGDARCTIMMTMSNDRIDSYVLSESSLFVYPWKMILKTCGTTTLLRCLDRLLQTVAKLGMRVEWMAYTRKDFQFPTAQKFPHRAPQEEATYLKKHFPEGDGFIMGPITGDHWFVYVADYVDRPTDQCVDRTLDMMMFGIDEEVAKLFVKDAARFPKDTDVSRAAGIDTLLPGSLIQEFCFEPCGYSMNGLLYDAYWTIHITPESHCSYASFETNIRMRDYSSLVKAVLAIFRPRKFTMTLFADEHGVRHLKADPFTRLLPVPLVSSTAAAIAGPCVIMTDTHGNTHVTYPGAAAAAAAAAVASSVGGTVVAASPRKIPDGIAAGVAGMEPLSLEIEEKKSVSSTDAAAAGDAGDGAVVVLDATGSVAAVAAVNAAQDAAIATFDAVARAAVEGCATPSLPSPDRTPAASAFGAPKVALARQASKGTMTSRKAALAYVLSAKCATEFVGEYRSVLGNYVLVHTGATSSDALTSVAEAATERLANPRLKYVFAKPAEALANRVRADSL